MKTHFCLRRGGLCIEVTCRYRVGWSGLPYQVSQLYDSICELTNLTIGILLDYTDNQVPALVVGLGLLFLTSWAVQFGSPWVLVSRQGVEKLRRNRSSIALHQAMYHKPRSTADFTDFDYDIFTHMDVCVCVRACVCYRDVTECTSTQLISDINECKSKNMPTHQKQKIISSLAMLK